MGLTDQQLAALVSLYQILNALLEAGGWALPPDPGASGGVGDAVGDATVHTGDATGIGVNAGTSITQNVNAKAEGGSINASQDALVANVGLGVANTGGNVAAGVATGSGGGGINAQAIATLADFLAALSGGSVSPDGTDRRRRAVRLRWPDRVADGSRGDDRPARRLDARRTSSARPTIPRARRRKHIRVRQVIGTLTFSFSSANGQDKAETIGKVTENDTETDDTRRTVAQLGPNSGVPPLRRPGRSTASRPRAVRAPARRPTRARSRRT